MTAQKKFSDFMGLLSQKKIKGGFLFILFTITSPAYSDVVIPFWHSSGDNISANIVFSTIAENLKRESTPDMKIKSAALKKEIDNSFSIDINVEILKPQFRGTLCSVNTLLAIKSITPAGTSVEIKSAKVKVCNSKNGTGMDSLIRAAVGIALNNMIPDMENNIQNSMNDIVLPLIKTLKEKTKKNVGIEYAVYDEGLSFFLYTGNLMDEPVLKKLSYSLHEDSGCMTDASINVFQLPSNSSNAEDRIRLFVKNNSNDAADIEAVLASSAMKGEINSEKIKKGTEFYWSDFQNKYNGSDFSVSIRLFSVPEPGKGAVLDCGKMSFEVPARGSVLIEMMR